MSFNKSPLAFDDMRDVFEKALNSAKGVRIPCANRGAAIVLRSRLNYFRKINRDENRQIYSLDHPMHGRSVYDKLVLRIAAKGDKEDNVLYVEQRTIDNLIIEEIQ